MSDIQLPPKTEEFTKAFEESGAATLPSKTKGKFFLRLKKRLPLMIGVFLLVLALTGAGGIFAYGKAKVFQARIDDLETAGRQMYDAVKVQNLSLAGEKLEVLRQSLDAFDSEYKKIAFVGSLPFARAYYQDGTHALKAGYAGLASAETLIKAVEPYADVLGFKGQGSFTGGSAEERIVKIIETLDKVTPSLDLVIKNLDTVSQELATIDEQKYPEEFKGMAVRSLIGQAKSTTAGIASTIKMARPIIEVLPDVVGGKIRKKYLVLFQNSGELRPTGGFMTGYAILNVDKGKVEAEGSGDIYDLDAKFRAKPPIPSILKRFLTTETRFNLRDMNISPDFKVSMDTFYPNYQKVPGQPQNFDGIIGVDTHLLESLVAVLGPVEVPGFGIFSAQNDKRCDCPQIIYELSEIVDRPTNYIKVNRKGILGPMMKSILTKAYGAPKTIWPALFQTAWKNVEGKHIQLYFFDPKAQLAAEAVDAAGRIKPTPENSDYLTIVDSNLAGAKSNFFVEQKVEHEISLPENGVVKHKVVVMYKNPFAASNCSLLAGQLCLNGSLNDWVRFYLPLGAKLLDSQGFDSASVLQSQDLEHEVVEGVFKLQPKSQARVEITYALPYQDMSKYQIYMQKQGGTEDIEHTFIVNGQEYKATLDKGQSFQWNW